MHTSRSCSSARCDWCHSCSYRKKVHVLYS